MWLPIPEKENRALTTGVFIYAARPRKDRKIVYGLSVCRRSGLPMPVAGRSLRASCPPLARCRLRSAIHGSARRQRRLPGTGSPSLCSPVAQVFNLCVFPVRIGLGRDSRTRNSPSETRSDAGATRASQWSLRSRELTHRRWVGELIPAGAEHVSGRLRCRDDARYSRAGRMGRLPSDRRRRKERVPRPGLEPGTL